MRLAALLGLAVPLAAQAAAALPPAAKTLTVPCLDGTAMVQVRSGALPRGVNVVVRSGGRIVGTVAPFGVRNGGAGTYVFPLPAGLAHDGKVALTLSRTEVGTADRAPSPQEVEAVSVVCR